MDSDIEIVESHVADTVQMEDNEIFTDFSQVKIVVHEKDVAKKLLENLADHSEEQHETDFVFPVEEVDVGQSPQNYPEEYEDDEIEDHEIPAPEDQLEEISEREEEHALDDHVEKRSLDRLTYECTDYSDVQVKEEIELFDATDFIDYDESPTDTYDNDLPPEDIYHFNNRIILGSKPCQEIAETNLQRETDHHSDEFNKSDDEFQNGREDNFNAVVLLVDWSIKLKNNPSFCEECGILFPSFMTLNAHKMACHSLLIAVDRNVAVKSTTKPAFAKKSTGAIVKYNIARKSTALVTSKKFCNHCNMTFPDHETLIKHLYEHLPLKQFKCDTCNAYFNNQIDLFDHNSTHIKLEVKDTQNIDKIVSKKLVFEEDVKRKQFAFPKKEARMIPMSVLFQCPTCKIHFLTALAGMQHWISSCSKGTMTTVKERSCKICKRKLRCVDLATHKKQHEICTKFRVYKVTKNLYERTLCTCPKCGLHFNEMPLQVHLKSCGKIPSGTCNKCNILLPKFKMDWHLKKHTKQNLKPRDFIIVQYFIKNKTANPPALAPSAKKSKLDSNNKIKLAIPVKELGHRQKTRKRGNDAKMWLNLCKNCNTCCKSNKNKLIHMSKQCKFGEKVICPDCGLQFNINSIKSHKKMHKTKSFTVLDIIFFQIGTNRQITPSIPDYPQCKDCMIKFFSTSALSRHYCGEDYKTCITCGDRYHNSAFDSHVQFHKLTKTENKKTDETILPELLKNYESLNIMLNIVFRCSKCDIITDSYDKAIEHSQGHLDGEISKKNIKCYICNLKFEEKCWPKHSELHTRLKINSNYFKILVYNPNNLLTEEWFELFDSVPEHQIKKITDESLYGYQRKVKVKLLRNGRSENTLYCCNACNVSFPPHQGIAKHMTEPCRKTANNCEICGVSFMDAYLLTSHKKLHSKKGLTNDFRIVTFIKFKEISDMLKVQGSNLPVIKIFKCRVCKSSMRYKQKIHKHRCNKNRSAKCEKCKLTITKSFRAKHKLEHKMYPKFNDMIKIELFNPHVSNSYSNDDDDDDDDDNEDTYYDAFEPPKKKYKSLQKPSATQKKVKTDTSKATSAITSKTDVASTSKVTKAGTSKLTKADTSTTDESKTATVYKCDCGLHFTSMKTVEKHKEKQCPDYEISTENCSKCGLLFPTDILVSHLCKHHSANTKIVTEIYQKDMTEAISGNVETTSGKRRLSKSYTFASKQAKALAKHCKKKVFKCSECNVYFMSESTCYKHVYKSHLRIDLKRCIECSLCGLLFSAKTLSLHMSEHHQNAFSLDNVLVAEYQPPPRGCQELKINVYVASQTVQSLQVTSSVD